MFNEETAKKSISDARRRTIEADARIAAEEGRLAPQGLRSEGTGSWADKAQAALEVVLWDATFARRKARLERKKEET